MTNDNSIAILFANKIKEKIDRALSLCNMPYVSNDSEEKFELIKSLSSLVSELLDKDNFKDKLLNLANTSAVNGNDNEIKIETFDFIRNILIHFPIFESWDEIYLSKELLGWNKPYNGSIAKYLNNNSGKTFTYRIFLNEDNEWVEKHTITVTIPKLEDSNKIYLKDILSLDNAIWTFGIIDYYLKDLGLTINPYAFTVSL